MIFFPRKYFKEFMKVKSKKQDYFILMNKKKYVERFRDRVIFPINNISGDPIALGGRILKR